MKNKIFTCIKRMNYYINCDEKYINFDKFVDVMRYDDTWEDRVLNLYNLNIEWSVY